ncbi:hypothetical protein [Chryseobacterium taiwanense]|uniref:DUF3592 domain-containing protein n=2 Tax=Chryseobacterium taiwanense TaxID=363331 RepID=A0A0B4CIP4_9FLAO|nr:hypothetical protein [Chryseobacterium taiwanense]KIC61154.1 hypothetical protein RM51_18590 [Chryseobacterium taiwanense]
MINFSIKDGKIIESEPYLYSAADINKFRSFKNYIDKPIEIKYNPNNPKEFIISDQKTINKVGIFILTLIGFFFSLMGILDILGIIHI